MSTCLCGHDQTGSGGVDGDIARHETDVAKLCSELSVFLVAESLDGTGVYDTLVVLQTLGNCVFGNNRFSCRRVGRDQNTLIPLYRGDRHLLERIKGKGPYAGRLCGGLVLGNGDVVVVWREGDLMADLVREHYGLSILCLALQPRGGSHLSRLLRLESVCNDGLGLDIALLAPLTLLARSLAVNGRGCI